MDKKNIFWSILFPVSLATVVFLGGCTVDSSTSSSSKSSDYTEFEYNYAFLYYYYYKAGDELKTSQYYEENADTNLYLAPYRDVADVLFMYENMSDLFTRYYPSEFFDQIWSQLNESESNTSTGILVDSTLAVKRVYPGSSAENAGILKGDTILAVDSIDLEGSYDRYVILMDSTTRTTFLTEMKRKDSIFTVSLQKTEILLPTVYLDSVNGTPVVTITEFTDSTSNSGGTMAEFENVLNETDGASATVLDLRDNPGGSIDQCESMASMLLPKGDTVIIEKIAGPNASETKQVDSVATTIAQTDGIGKGRYYVLMLDSGSASCAEIFSVALTANLKTPVVGELSFGKGIGQYYIETEAGGIASATAIRLFDKDGESYHTYGIVPDFEIADADSALNKAVALAQEGTYTRTAGYGTTTREYWTQTKAKKTTGSPSIKTFKRDGAFRIINLPETATPQE